MPTQAAALNDDSNGKLTSGYYADRGDGTSNWFNVGRIFNGGDVAKGATTDAAVTNPASAGSVIALLKGLLTFLRVSAAGVGKAEDAAHADGDTGVMALGVRRDTMAASSGSTGDYEPLQLDSSGRLRTVDNRVGALSNATSTAIEATRVVKASAGTLFGVQGHAAAAGFVWICDKASAPSGSSDNLRVAIYVSAAGPFSIDFGRYGRAFANGIALGFSSNATATSWTSSSNAFFDAQYE